MKNLAVLGVFALALLLAAGVAESTVDTVILATTVNYPDAIIAAPASVKFGAPVLFTEQESIPQETLDTLASLNPKTVVIVGGPFVVKQAVEDSLKGKGYNVVRLWGYTQYGTAVEIAKFFWPDGIEKAVIVYDTLKAPAEDNTKELLAAKVIATREKIPIFLVPADGLPDEVNSTLVLLGARKVVIVGSRAATIEAKLKDFVVEKIAGKDDEETLEKANLVRDKVVIAAVADFRHAVAASVEPNGHAAVLLVSSESQITRTVNKVLGMTNVTEVKVVGKPELAQKVCSAFGNATVFELDCRKEDRLSKIADEIREKKLKWKAINKELKFVRLAVNCKKLFEKDDEELEEASTDAEAAEEGTSDVSSANTSVSRAKELCAAGNFTQAMLTLQKARNEIIKIKYRLRVKANRNMDSDESDERAVKVLKSTQRLKELRDRLATRGKALAAIDRILEKRAAATVTGEGKKLTIRGSRFKFTPNTITVAKGDKVEIKFINDDGSHNLCAGDWGCTRTIAAGQSAELKFTADKAGTFTFWCNVAGHRAQGMEGNLTVTG